MDIRKSCFSKRVTRYRNRLPKAGVGSLSLEVVRTCRCCTKEHGFLGNSDGRWMVGVDDLKSFPISMILSFLNLLYFPLCDKKCLLGKKIISVMFSVIIHFLLMNLQINYTYGLTRWPNMHTVYLSCSCTSY